MHINIKRDRCPWRAKQKPGLEQTQKKRRLKQKGKMAAKNAFIVPSTALLNHARCSISTKKNKKAIVK